MGPIKLIAEFFLLSLGFGVGLFSPIASSQLTGVGFLKLLSTTCGVSFFLAALIHFSVTGLWKSPEIILYFFLALICLLNYLFHRDVKSKFMWFLYGAFCSASCALLFYMSQGDYSIFLYRFSSVLFLGIITYAMILGHWYLVVPKLSEKPLANAVNLIWILVVLKFISTAIHAFKAPMFSLDLESGANLDYSFNWLMLSMRIGWGYLIIAILNYYTSRLVKIRSIQSATGVLYVMTFFVFVGEIIATYMFIKSGARL